MKTRLSLSLLAVALGTAGAVAQSAPSAADTQASAEMRQSQGSYWSVCFGGSADKNPFAMVKINTITSLSRQRYLLNGTMSVWELVIDTTGNNSIRIYYIDTPGSKAGAAGDLASKMPGLSYARENMGLNGAECVTKTYPESTHTHTVEYRVLNLDALKRIQKSLMRSMATGRGDTLMLPAEDCPAS